MNAAAEQPATESPAQPDPLEALIAAHAPSARAPRLVRLPSEAATVDWEARRCGPRPAYGDSDFPRGLIPVSGIRCGEYL